MEYPTVDMKCVKLENERKEIAKNKTIASHLPSGFNVPTPSPLPTAHLP
jgi:hypothetical protein